MSLLISNTSPTSEIELLQRCHTIEGLTFAQLSLLIDYNIPQQKDKRKGWAGNAIEIALGSTAGTKAIPDFDKLGIELKTIPFNNNGKPAESTFVTSISLLTIHHENWLSSQCYQKLQRILWVPVEGDRTIPFEQRRIGSAHLWSPNPEDEAILARDWHELTTMVGTGKLEEINATIGEYLQIRPKAANARSLSYGFDSKGCRIPTLPRGFYLRSTFTEKILIRKI